jgi:hypothetical protein
MDVNNRNPEKRKATLEQRKAQFESQTIKIDDNWAVERFDEQNWVLKYKDQFRGYYGFLVDAFRSLPRKMLNQEACGSLQNIHEHQLAIEERIMDAIKEHEIPA